MGVTVLREEYPGDHGDGSLEVLHQGSSIVYLKAQQTSHAGRKQEAFIIVDRQALINALEEED